MVRSKHNPERGIALIAVMFALLLLTGIAMGLMYMAETETSINYNYRTAQMAYFASKAGLEEARIRLLPPHPFTGVGGGDLGILGLPSGTPGANDSVVYILNPRPGEVVNPLDPGSRTFDTELCHLNYTGLGLFNPGYNTPCTAGAPGAPVTRMMASMDPFTGTAGSMAYKWVRLTRKTNNSNGDPNNPPLGWVDPTNLNPNAQVCWNGRNQQIIPLGQPSCEIDALGQRTRLTTVMLATSLAIAQNGSRRMVSTEIALNPPLKSNGAVESEDEVILNGQLLVSGYDNCRCKCDTSAKPVVCKDRVTGLDCGSGEWSVYSNSVVDDPNKSQNLIAPKVPTVAENAPWEQDIPQLIEDFKNAADAIDVRGAPYNWTCSGVPANCGTQSNTNLGTLPANFPNHDPLNPGPYDSQITYVPGDVKLTANDAHGSGVLVVDGDLEINGGLQFFGIIIVKGVVSFTGGGSANTNIIGAVLAGKSSIDNTVLGGSAVIQYDQCALSQNDVPQPPRVIAFREQAY